MQVKLAAGTRAATVIHAKDDADGDRHGFKLERAELGTDWDGDPITTLTVTEIEATPTSQAAPDALTNNEQIALSCLDKAIEAEGILATVGDNFEERNVATAKSWRDWFYRVGKPGDKIDTKRKAFDRARDALISKARIASRDDFVWRPDVW
jgi:hypothetical protein